MTEIPEPSMAFPATQPRLVARSLALARSHRRWSGRMTEIPEHLLKRAAAAREKAAADPAPEAGEPAAEAPASDPRIPAHLLERSRAAKANQAGGAPTATAEPGGGGVAVAERVGAVVAAPPAAAGVPVGAGPGGHTQRLLTVVKSGSIQEVKASPVDKVHTWPHLLVAEFVASLACLAFTFVFSIFVNAPLLQEANFNQTPNPSKAPWYFLGLQELLTMFHPMVAGVTIPGVGLIILIFAPTSTRTPPTSPRTASSRRADDGAPDVLGRARHHRFVLPGPGLQLRPCRGPKNSSSSCDLDPPDRGPPCLPPPSSPSPSSPSSCWARSPWSRSPARPTCAAPVRCRARRAAATSGAASASPSRPWSRRR